MAKDKDPKNTVVALPARAAAPDTPQPAANVVSLLESLLRSARAGELRAFAFAGVRDGFGDRVLRGWARDEMGVEHHALAAGIGDLQFAYARERYDFFDRSDNHEEATNGQEDDA